MKKEQAGELALLQPVISFAKSKIPFKSGGSSAVFYCKGRF